MPPVLSALFTAWLATEPMASAVMFVAAALILGAGLVRIASVPATAAGRLGQGLVLIGGVAAFVGMAWGGYFLLNKSSTSFGALLVRLLAGGEAGQKQQMSVSTNWDGGLDQSELVVRQSVEKEVVQEIPQAQGKPTLYLRQHVVEPLDQQSVTSFSGRVDLHLVDPAWATFECRSKYDYNVANEADVETTAEFSLPISGTRLYKNISVVMDGKPARWSIQNNALYWKTSMAPHQQSRVEIAFETRGMGHFSYVADAGSVIQHYSLTITADSTTFHPFATPDSTAIRFTNQPLVWQWTIDHAIMSPRIGAQVDRPPVSVLSTGTTAIIDYAARGLVLLLALVALTWLICGVEIDLLRLGLLGGLVCAQFLALIAVYPLWMNAIVPALLFSLVTLAIAVLLMRRIGRLPLILSLVLIAIFATAYPFVGLVPGERERNAIDGAIQAGMILYIFGLTLYTRIRPHPASASIN